LSAAANISPMTTQLHRIFRLSSKQHISAFPPLISAFIFSEVLVGKLAALVLFMARYKKKQTTMRWSKIIV
jgi:hypothetical protein